MERKYLVKNTTYCNFALLLARGEGLNWRYIILIDIHFLAFISATWAHFKERWFRGHILRFFPSPALAAGRRCAESFALHLGGHVPPNSLSTREGPLILSVSELHRMCWSWTSTSISRCFSLPEEGVAFFHLVHCRIVLVYRPAGTSYPSVPRVNGRGGPHLTDLDLHASAVHHGQGGRLLTLVLLPYVVKDLSHCILFLLSRIHTFLWSF